MKTVLVLTHRDKDTQEVLRPHIHHLKNSNPNSDIHLIVGEDSERGRRHDWRNGDKKLREWWKINSDATKGDIIYVIEWDTLVTCELPDLPPSLDLAGKQMFLQSDKWWWWKERIYLRRMKLKEGEKPIGLISLGFFVMRRWVLDSICNPRWDEPYNSDIISEMRFPTAAKIEGAKVGVIPLPFVSWRNVKATNTPGIYHGVPEKWERNNSQ